MDDALKAAIAAIETELGETRHHLHANPEVSDHEEKTAAFVAERLRAMGLDARTGVGGHGVVADIEGAAAGRTVALRADIDALPIQEVAGRPHGSCSPGVMHACGHDGHTTILLGAARALTTLGGPPAGRVRLLFQPAEETVSGAERMVADGAMDGVDAVLALHGWPDLAIGEIGLRTGPSMASADRFDITIRGRGRHAAYPHGAIDPIVVGAQVVTALQTAVSRETDPLEPVVLSVTQFHAGTAYNIIPDTAALCGTLRTMSADVRASMLERIPRIANGVCAAAGATCEFRHIPGVPVVVNVPEMVGVLRQAAVEAGFTATDIARPSMGSEDFAVYLERAPGAMALLGLGGTPPLHTPDFDFDDRALPVGVELLCRAALGFLAG